VVGGPGLGGGGGPDYHGDGGAGVVRILWGTGRAFPSTNVALADSSNGQTII
jgi:hypothetical protein